MLSTLLSTHIRILQLYNNKLNNNNNNNNNNKLSNTVFADKTIIIQCVLLTLYLRDSMGRLWEITKLVDKEEKEKILNLKTDKWIDEQEKKKKENDNKDTVNSEMERKEEKVTDTISRLMLSEGSLNDTGGPELLAQNLLFHTADDRKKIDILAIQVELFESVLQDSREFLTFSE